RASSVLGPVLARDLPPAGRLHAELLAEQFQEDACLLVTETLHRLEALQYLGTVGIAVGPEGTGVTGVVFENVLGQFLNPGSHRGTVAVNRWFRDTHVDELLWVGPRDPGDVETVHAVSDRLGACESDLHR